MVKQLSYHNIYHIIPIGFTTMIKTILVLSLVLLTQSTLLTSSSWAKLGIDVTDGILQQTPQPLTAFDTVCNEVDLKSPPYSYNGVVRSGYLKVGKGNSVLAFLFYGKEGTSLADVPKMPTVIWLNGGPGSSSQLGNFMELGPSFIKPAAMAPYEIVANPHAWTKDYNVIFVDQPVGTGLSYADESVANVYCKSMQNVATDFYNALKELYQNSNGCFNKLGIKPQQDLYIFGESYAGKYAPAIGEKILREKQDNAGFLTGLKGVAVGDGFTHPYAILSQVGEYSYNLGLIDYQERARVEQVIINATYQERGHMWRDLHDSFDTVLDYIVTAAGGVNVYDFTKYHDYPTEILNEYFGNPTVKNLWKLNNDIVYGKQAGNVYEAMYEDFMMNYVHLVEELLRRGLYVLIYNGQNDIIVETPGTFKWAERVYYSDSEQFRKTLFSVWKVDGKTAGYYKSVGKFQLKTVNNAGHLVPMDQGAAAREMLNNFIKKTKSQLEQQ